MKLLKCEKITEGNDQGKVKATLSGKEATTYYKQTTDGDPYVILNNEGNIPLYEQTPNLNYTKIVWNPNFALKNGNIIVNDFDNVDLRNL